MQILILLKNTKKKHYIDTFFLFSPFLFIIGPFVSFFIHFYSPESRFSTKVVVQYTLYSTLIQGRPIITANLCLRGHGTCAYADAVLICDKYMKRLVDIISILAVGFLWDFGTGHSVLSSIRLQPVCPG